VPGVSQGVRHQRGLSDGLDLHGDLLQPGREPLRGTLSALKPRRSQPAVRPSPMAYILAFRAYDIGRASAVSWVILVLALGFRIFFIKKLRDMQMESEGEAHGAAQEQRSRASLSDRDRSALVALPALLDVRHGVQATSAGASGASGHRL